MFREGRDLAGKPQICVDHSSKIQFAKWSRYGTTAAQSGHSSKSRLQLCGMNGHARLREWARPSIALLGRSSSAGRPDVGDVYEAILKCVPASRWLCCHFSASMLVKTTNRSAR
jgi:hypothetical protein